MEQYLWGGIVENLHLSHEVVLDSAHADVIATASSSAARYTIFASATLIGDTDVQPHRPIYLTGLPDNMSGMWVVLAARHVINRKFHYTITVNLGTNAELLKQPPPEDGAVIDLNSITAKLLNQSNSFIVQRKNTRYTDYEFKSNEFYLSNKLKSDTFAPNYNPVKDFIDYNNLTSTNYTELVHSTYRPNFEPKSYKAEWVRKQ